MAPLALAYSVIQQGGGAGSLGLVLATNTVPTIVFLLMGGLFADRLSRSRLLFAGNLLAAGAQGAMAVSVATGHATTASIACGFVSGTAVSFIVPSTQGAVAQIVPEEHLQQANALLRLPSNAVRVLGPVAGGVVVAASGAAWALAWDAFTFAVAAVLLLGLRLEAPPATPAGVLADLRAGWTSFGPAPGCGPIPPPSTVLVAAWLAGFQLLGPLVAARQYAGARDWGLIQAAFASGLLAGTLICLRWKPYRLLTVAVITAGALALPLAAMACSVSPPHPGGRLAGRYRTRRLDRRLEHRVPTACTPGRTGPHECVQRRRGTPRHPLGYLITALAAHSWSIQAVLLGCAHDHGRDRSQPLRPGHTPCQPAHPEP
ncbi:MFS transporter [Streptomyces nogalater]